MAKKKSATSTATEDNDVAPPAPVNKASVNNKLS